MSFVSNYYKNGFHFFQPSNYNLMSVNGNAACEFPIIYYFTAFLYLLFGEKEYLLKTIHLIIFSIGLYHVYKLSFLILKNRIQAYLIPLFILSSTSLVYYSFNFLPDTPALGFAFSGWYFIYRFKEETSLKLLLLTTLFFGLSSLLKVTYLVHPIAAYAMIFMNYYFVKSNIKIDKKSLIKLTLFFAIALVSVVLWNIFVLYYNEINNSVYYTTNILPIWDLSVQERAIYWRDILSEWYKKYLAETSFHFLLFSCLFSILMLKKITLEVKWILVFLLIGSIVYFILFFHQFRYHDYYSLLFFPLIVFLLISFFESFQNAFQNKKIGWILNLGFIIITLAGLNYARMKTTERYENGCDSVSKIGFLLRKNKLEIDKLNIPLKARVIIGPDLSVNGGLYSVHREGWVINSKSEITSKKMKQLKNFGANYFILTENDLTSQKVIEQDGKRIFQNNDLSVYKL